MKRINKQVIIVVIILLIVAFSWLGIRKTFFPELEAERLINKYYQAIIDEDYEKAYQYLYIYDQEKIDSEGSRSAGTSLTETEAKQFYHSKISFLKEQNYRVKDYKIVEVEYEDGHSFWHHLVLEVEIDGEIYHKKELAFLQNERLMIGEQDDLFAPYRDGRMNISIAEAE